jgi:hypothetical protein
MTEKDMAQACSALERIGLVLGALYSAHLGEVDQSIKAERLHRCGFSNADVAALLGTTTNAINVALHRARKTSRRKSPKAKKK